MHSQVVKANLAILARDKKILNAEDSRVWVNIHAKSTQTLGNKILSELVLAAFDGLYPKALFQVWVNKEGQVCASSDRRQWRKNKPNLDVDNASGKGEGPWGVVIGLQAGIVDKQRTVMLRVFDASAGQFKGVFSLLMRHAIKFAKLHAQSIKADNVLLLPTNSVTNYWKKCAKANDIAYRTDRRPL